MMGKTLSLYLMGRFARSFAAVFRSEEHTSELQSH